VASNDELEGMEWLLHAAGHPELDDRLSATDLERVLRQRQQLQAIDAVWHTADPTAIERMRNKTLARLRERGIEYRWAPSTEVRTLGDLVRASEQLSALLPAEALNTLATDPTILERLVTDAAARTTTLAASSTAPQCRLPPGRGYSAACCKR